MLDPLVGQGKKSDVSKQIGPPAFCKNREGTEHCEYRTAKARNLPVPDSSRQTAVGIDLSPYEYFDVLLLHYNSFGVLVEWDPVYLAD